MSRVCPTSLVFVVLSYVHLSGLLHVRGLTMVSLPQNAAPYVGFLQVFLWSPDCYLTCGATSLHVLFLPAGKLSARTYGFRWQANSTF